MRIELSAYDPAWPRLYAREEARLRAILGARALCIEHVGSTAVPGLAAKPIVDVVLEVADTVDEWAYVPDMEAAGYTLRFREPAWFEHRFFEGPDTDVSLHVFPARCAEVERMLAFRDRLRAHAGDRALYERTKRTLAGREWPSVQAYAEAKTSVVAEILGRAG